MSLFSFGSFKGNAFHFCVRAYIFAFATESSAFAQIPPEVDGVKMEMLPRATPLVQFIHKFAEVGRAGLCKRSGLIHDVVKTLFSSGIYSRI